MKKTIAPFAFLTMAFMASAADHYWIGPAVGRWSEKNNWSSKSVPSTGNGTTSCHFTNDVTVITDHILSKVTLNIKNGSHVTFTGAGGLGTTNGVTAKVCNFTGGASLTLDGAYLSLSGSTSLTDGTRLILTNNSVFVGYSGVLKYPNNTYIEINGGCTYRNFIFNGAGTNCTIRLRNGANLTSSGVFNDVGTNSTIIVEGGSTLRHGGSRNNYWDGMCGVTIIVRDSSLFSLEEQGGSITLARTGGNKLIVTGGSTFRVTGNLYTGSGTVISNENSTISVSGKLLMAQADKDKAVAAGEQFFFVGENAQMTVGGAVEFNNAAAASAGATFNFSVPELGYLDAPFRATSTSAKIFGNPTNIKPNGVNERFVHVKLLASSPALDPAYAYATLSKLFFTYAGLQKFEILDCQVEGADNRATFRYTEVDGETETSTAANVRYVLAQMENGPGGKELRTRGVTESEGVAENTTLAVDRKLFTLSSAVTQLADAPLETYAVLYAGETADTLVPVSERAIAEAGTFQMTWSGAEYVKTYRLRVALETRNALGEVTHVEWSPVRSAATVDATDYTWRDVDGDWTGDWGDNAHWSNNKNGDCLGHPASVDANVYIPAGHPVVINLDAAYKVGKFYATGANTSLRLTVPAGMRDVNKLATFYSHLSSYSSFGGTNNLIVFDGVNANLGSLKVSLGKDSSLVFSNSAWCTTYQVTVNNPGAWVRILGGSTVGGFGTTPSCVLGASTTAEPCGIVVDDSTYGLTNSLQLTSGASSVTMGSFTIRGRRGRVVIPSQNQDMTIYSESIYPNDHRFIFDVPAGGFAATPLRVTATSTKQAAFYQNKTGAQIGAIFEVTRDSGVFDSGEKADYPLFTSTTGINRQFVTFVRPKHVRSGNAFLYGTATASPYGWELAAGFAGTAKAIGLRVTPPPGTMFFIQ